MNEISSYVKLSPKESVMDNWEIVNDRGTPTAGEIIAAIVLGVVVYFVIHFVFNLFLEFRPIRDLMYRRDYTYSDEEAAVQRELDRLRYGAEKSTTDFAAPEATAESPFDKEQKIRELEDRRSQLRAASRPHGLGWLFEIRNLLALGIPLMLFAWPLFTRPQLHGFIYLTNWRLLYFAYGQNRFRSVFHLQTANLADVLGVNSFYSEGRFGKKQLRIMIHTRFRDGLSIAAGNSGMILSRIPLLGKWLDKILIRDTLGKDAFALLPVLYSRIRQNAGAAATSSVNY
jgi:hypothetical protein